MSISEMRLSGITAVIGGACILGLAQPAAAGNLCPQDIDGSGDVGFTDLVAVLVAWGPCPGCPEDIDEDGSVGFADLLEVLTAWGDCPGSDLRAIELAGNALTNYPHFEFVKAFNDGTPVLIAIDPGNLVAPGLSGDIYVTTAKSADQWLADPALVDVRGAPQPETFAGATIQANTFTLSDSSTLDADAGTGLGVGYDLVVDFNTNGVLDAGDYIDGFGSEAGFYKVHDIAELGPLAVSELTYLVEGGSVTPGFQGENTFYPSDIASMGQLPLVVVSHGNGHNYQWYDYLGHHLASYGYIMMSHQNNTVPGIETASTTTYQHTDAFLGQLATIGGGVLEGHVDSSRIIWIGHSRGGEGVARAYTRVHDGLVSTEHYDADDIVAVSSIAPNNALGPGVTEPRLSNYHLLWGAADGDISGAAFSGVWSFAIYERAEGFRQSTYVHGADHNDFNCCGFDDFTGPPGTAIGRAEAQQVAKAVYLALVKRYADGNIPALDYLWRQYERFKPIGVADTTTVVSEYKEGANDPHFIIDDFQTGAGFALSSSGGSVTFNVTNPTEGQLRDTDGTYTWTGGDVMNGMSRANPTDVTRGSVFDWTGGTRFLEYEVVESMRDFSDHVYLTFRACQQTQHPLTVAELADLTFSVTLRDGDGDTGTINFGVYGGGIEEVYQRSGGWQNEFETIRIRLTDFTHNGTSLDLSNVHAVRFDFGGGFGSTEGRIGFDDLALSRDTAPPPAGAISMSLTGPVPDLVAPGESLTTEVSITASSEEVAPGSPTLHYRFGGGAFTSTPLDLVGGDLYEGTLPAPECGDMPEFYFSAAGSETGEITLPQEAPDEVFSIDVGFVVATFDDDFETDTGWTVVDIDLLDGAWERGVPAGGGDRGDPPTDYDGSGNCYVTDNEDGNSDVDGGPTIMTSPLIDVTSLSEPRVRYARWFTNDDGDIDRLDVELSNNDGVSWVPVESVPGASGWFVQDVRIADFLAPTSTMRIRFSATDNPNDSVTEGGIDAVRFFEVICE